MKGKPSRRAILIRTGGEEIDHLLDGDVSSRVVYFTDLGSKLDFNLSHLRDVEGVMRPVYHEYDPDDDEG